MTENKQQLQQQTAAVAAVPAAQAFNPFDPVQFDMMQRFCMTYAKSQLVPEMYQITEKNPADKAVGNCMVALEMAQRIGASPLMVMQNLVVIYGRPSWSSKFLIATVNTCGKFEPLKFRFTDKGMLGMVDYVDYDKTWVQPTNGGRGYYKKEAKNKQFDGKKLTDIECVAYTSAKGSDQILESSPISLRLAIKEGWYTKDGSKWQTMPRQMLMYRAASFWTNVYAPELSMGMRTVEENQDIHDAEFEDITQEVNAMKEAAANKEEIGFDTEEEPRGQVPAEPRMHAPAQEAEVDIETGEVGAADPAGQLPGF